MEIYEEDKEYLLNLSRKSLEYYFVNGAKYSILPNEVPEKLKMKGATFVTLNKNSSLRGCMGRLSATQPIYLDVIDNTYCAALKDPRFPALELNELEAVQIEISLLSKLRKIDYSCIDDVCRVLDEKKPGVLIRSGFCQATYLPQVWESLTDPEIFLSQLCVKAGLKPDAWREEDLEIEIYDVVKCSEKQP